MRPSADYRLPNKNSFGSFFGIGGTINPMLFWLNNHKRLLLASLLSITTVVSTLVAYQDYRIKHDATRQVPDAVRICPTPSPTNTVVGATPQSTVTRGSSNAAVVATQTAPPTVTATATPSSASATSTAAVSASSPTPSAASIDGYVPANGATPCPDPTRPVFIATATATTNVVVPLPSPTNTATALPTATQTIEP